MDKTRSKLPALLDRERQNMDTLGTSRMKKIEDIPWVLSICQLIFSCKQTVSLTLKTKYFILMGQCIPVWTQTVFFLQVFPRFSNLIIYKLKLNLSLIKFKLVFYLCHFRPSSVISGCVSLPTFPGKYVFFYWLNYNLICKFPATSQRRSTECFRTCNVYMISVIQYPCIIFIQCKETLAWIPNQPCLVIFTVVLLLWLEKLFINELLTFFRPW